MIEEVCSHSPLLLMRESDGARVRYWCGGCGVERPVLRRHPAPPSMDERAAYFRRTGTSVAEQVGDGRPSLAARLTVRAGLAVYRGLVWVHEKLQARRAR